MPREILTVAVACLIASAAVAQDEPRMPHRAPDARAVSEIGAEAGAEQVSPSLDCRQALQGFDRTVSEAGPGQAGIDEPGLREDLRVLREAAIIFGRRGDAEGCAMVVTRMTELAVAQRPEGAVSPSEAAGER